MRRGFTSLGVGVVNMVVKGNLVPIFRHFKQVVPCQLPTNQARFPGYGHSKIMGQLKSIPKVPLFSDQFFHDLE